MYPVFGEHGASYFLGVSEWLTAALLKRSAKRGLASLCLGGGNAVAMVVERP